MGYFSWLFCDRGNKENLRIDRLGHILCPDDTFIDEPEYEGYGEFNGVDAYDLVADWNRKHLAEHPEYMVPQPCGRPTRPVSSYPWYAAYSDLTLSHEQVVDRVMKTTGEKFFEYRFIGIDIACYDEQNAALPFPLKITKAKRGRHYADLPASKGDPEQGCEPYHPKKR